MMYSGTIVGHMKEHAEKCYPNESCGLVLNDIYVECENVADEPQSFFKMSWDEIGEHSKEIDAVVHSHPEGPQYPSASDMRSQLSFGIPFGIIPLFAKENSEDGVFLDVRDPFWFGDGVKKPPLIGRGFRHGVTDCYSIIRDWYSENRGVTLLEFPRDWEWWNHGEDLYAQFFSKAGFSELMNGETPDVGDVFLAAIATTTLNHAGIYLGNGEGLHHLTSSCSGYDPNTLSLRSPMERYMKFITKWIRYRNA